MNPHLIVSPVIGKSTGNHFRNFHSKYLPSDGVDIAVDNAANLVSTLRQGPEQNLQVTNALRVSWKVVDDIWKDNLPVLGRSHIPDIARDFLLKFQRNVLLTNRIEIIFLALEMQFEISKEFWHRILDGGHGSKAVGHNQLGVQQIIGVYSKLGNKNMEAVVVLVELEGMVMEIVVESFENNLVFVLGMLVVYDAQAVQMGGKHVQVVLHLVRGISNVDNFERSFHGIHITTKGLVSELHERERTPLVFRSEDATTTDDGSHGEQKVDNIGNRGHGETDEHESLGGVEISDGIEESGRSSQGIQSEAADPIGHSPLVLPQESIVGKRSPHNTEEEKNGDEVEIREGGNAFIFRGKTGSVANHKVGHAQNG
jgi:hypothetical protein